MGKEEEEVKDGQESKDERSERSILTLADSGLPPRKILNLAF